MERRLGEAVHSPVANRENTVKLYFLVSASDALSVSLPVFGFGVLFVCVIWSASSPTSAATSV